MQDAILIALVLVKSTQKKELFIDIPNIEVI